MTRGPVVAIGIFDGAHRGHQHILTRAVRRARGLRATPVALTFWPHPAAVVAPWRVPTLLLSLAQRRAAFARCGIRRTVVLSFTRAVSRWSPEQFVERVLVRRLHAREVVVGHDFRFGRGRVGDTEMLRALATSHGIRVHVVPPVRVGGVRVSSRRVRQAVVRGQLALVRRWLGRQPTVVGRVVAGAGRGKRVGIPTANVAVAAGVLPPTGVYAVWVCWLRRAEAGPRPSGQWGNAWVPGVANLGWRPTVESHRPKTPVLEVHMLRRQVPLLRGRTLEVAFGRRLRPERRFPSVGALVAQIRRDIAAARAWLSGPGRQPR